MQHDEGYYNDEMIEGPITKAIRENTTPAQKKALFEKILGVLRSLNRKFVLNIDDDLLVEMARTLAVGDPDCDFCHGDRQHAEGDLKKAIDAFREKTTQLDIVRAAMNSDGGRAKRFLCGGICIGVATIVGSTVGSGVYSAGKSSGWWGR